jgi:hypothetical protein
MNVIARKIILAAAVLVIFDSTYSQTNNNPGLVSVNLSIVGKGTPTICSDSSNYYFANLRVANTQDTAIRFWIMDCSWPVDNWVINNDAASLRFCGCDSNIPVEIILSPRKSIEFYSAIKCHKKGSSTNRIKVGFVYFTNAQDIFNINKANSWSIKNNIFWSNEVELRNNLYTYEVK